MSNEDRNETEQVYASVKDDREIFTPDALAWPSSDERVQRYAEAIYTADAEVYPRRVSAWRQSAWAVMTVADAEQAELRAENERLAAELASTIEDYTEAVQNFGRARVKVSRVKALATHLDTLAPGDRHYAGRIRAALDGDA